MHLTRQQHRLIYLVLAFFITSRNFSIFFYSVVPGASSYYIPIILFALAGIGYYIKQDELPWQLALYFGFLKLIPLLPLEKICRSNLHFFTLAILIIFSFIFLLIFKRDSIGELFGGNVKARVAGTGIVKNWLQAGLLFVLVYGIWAFIRGPMLSHSLPSLSKEILVYSLLMALYNSLAVYSLPIAFLRGKLDKEELLVGLALGLGLFERHFLIGSFYSTLLFLVVGWFFARATYETKGSLLTTAMLFFYMLGSLI